MILVLGAHGQVGRALRELLPAERLLAVDQPELDLSRPLEIPMRLDALARGRTIEALINVAAYTQVEQAEAEEPLARRINAEAPGVIASWCAARGIPGVHFSTDYVFDGRGTRPFREDDPVGPLSVYGRTKQAGEAAVAAAGGRYLILRTSWVYAEEGKNFVRTMLALGAQREELRVVDDQVGAPTYALDAARGALDALESARRGAEFPSGIYHLTNSGETSWRGFADAIFEEARARGRTLVVRRVLPVSSVEYPTRAERPLNSRLDGAKLERVLGVRLRPWREALGACMDRVAARGLW